jgi:mannose-1-phosphate guanylyltransferase
MYAVILAGGGGTRLWPLSSPERPKPFLPLIGERTLLQLTVDRLDGVVDPDSIFVVTDQRYAGLVGEQLPDATVLAEPIGRNTAPAIALATVAIERADDEVMLVLPADQTIKDVPRFQEILRAAERELARGSFGLDVPLVTLGVEPARPATEYGYLVADLFRAQGPTHGDGHLQLDAYVVRSFVEKPNGDLARELLAQAGVAWNAGMFMWRRGAIRAALEAFAGEILEQVADGVRLDALERTYPEVPSTSIDFAVMEAAAGAGLVVMGTMDVGWNDLGSWTALLGALGLPGITAVIARPGEPYSAGSHDLVVQRRPAGQLSSGAGSDSTMTAASGPVAILSGAHQFKARIDALLARCSIPEASQ